MIEDERATIERWHREGTYQARVHQALNRPPLTADQLLLAHANPVNENWFVADELVWRSAIRLASPSTRVLH